MRRKKTNSLDPGLAYELLSPISCVAPKGKKCGANKIESSIINYDSPARWGWLTGTPRFKIGTPAWKDSWAQRSW
jgi:hypothetical protein